MYRTVSPHGLSIVLIRMPPSRDRALIRSDPHPSPRLLPSRSAHHLDRARPHAPRALPARSSSCPPSRTPQRPTSRSRLCAPPTLPRLTPSSGVRSGSESLSQPRIPRVTPIFNLVSPDSRTAQSSQFSRLAQSLCSQIFVLLADAHENLGDILPINSVLTAAAQTLPSLPQPVSDCSLHCHSSDCHLTCT